MIHESAMSPKPDAGRNTSVRSADSVLSAMERQSGPQLRRIRDSALLMCVPGTQLRQLACPPRVVGTSMHARRSHILAVGTNRHARSRILADAHGNCMARLIGRRAGSDNNGTKTALLT